LLTSVFCLLIHLSLFLPLPSFLRSHKCWKQVCTKHAGMDEMHSSLLHVIDRNPTSNPMPHLSETYLMFFHQSETWSLSTRALTVSHPSLRWAHPTNHCSTGSWTLSPPLNLYPGSPRSNSLTFEEKIK
jgi:hypothetical protein